MRAPSLVAMVAVIGCTQMPTRPELVYVAGGTYRMGCTQEQSVACLSDETPVTVELDDFWIGKYEITNRQYAEFLNATGNRIEGGAPWYRIDRYALLEQADGVFTPKAGFERYAVTNVSWYGAVAYAKWLSAVTHSNYRLPTEAEWEYAARGGRLRQGTVYSGSDRLAEVAWCSAESAGSGTGWGFKQDKGVHAVGGKRPSPLGIHDMSGNVSEWTADVYDNVNIGGINPRGPESGSLRVMRGGSWDNAAEECRVSARSRGQHVSRFAVNNGFRIARDDSAHE